MAIGPTIIMHSYIVILHKAQQSRPSASIGHSLMMRFLLLFALLSIFFLLLSQNLVSSHGALCTALAAFLDGSPHYTGALQILQYNAIRCIQMNHVLLEFLHSKQTEEEAILKADEMVTVAERQQEGRAYAIIA